ncbi:pyridoxamine 5'-phosphate oxidase family protein [Adhaeribacter swui]|uniref:Pyridoxamine 5'-phosphate oxidase family protein n=1 Tax=Adhaeribacter swui TaxID=2086471 RepID=A0A7G7G9X2_9BACT|nr:pyridoxamine 5'-phosphate oxidase family protein [Adhaeribacter swui]QNF33956.1 pyridoxamine 5'-phosphate oxidase family protein [Adhaeribacter swui]
MLRELDEKENIEFLRKKSFGRIGCTDGDNVYIVPLNYQYEDNSIVCYSLEGLKIDIMRKHPTVCFEVDEVIDSNNWKSVVINGRFEEITDKAELDLLRPRYNEYFLRKRTSLASSGQAQDANNLQDIKLVQSDQVFYRIRFTKITGRLETDFI